jgi:hypothetical protein
MMTSKLLTSITDDSKMLNERYRVYRDGRIISLYTANAIRPKPLVLNGTVFEGQNYVTLRDESNEPERVNRARLIATLFVPNPNNYIHLAFLDGNKRNCAASNLKWTEKVQRTEEQMDSYADKKWAYMYAITKDGELEGIYTSFAAISAVYRVSNVTVQYAIANQTPIRNKFYVNRYERGSEEANELWELLHADKEKRHVN